MDRVQTIKERPSPKGLFGAKTINFIGSSFRRNAHYKTKTITKKGLFDTKTMKSRGFSFTLLIFYTAVKFPI